MQSTDDVFLGIIRRSYPTERHVDQATNRVCTAYVINGLLDLEMFVNA